MIILLIAIACAYLLGSIPFSLIVAKVMGGVDVRKRGSGNVGATNVLRTAGKAPGIIALACDIAKGVLPVTVMSGFFYQYSIIINEDSLKILLGFAAICGHIWPVFLKFKGGKGVATSSGVLAILCPKAFAVAVLVFLLTVALTKYVSLGSVVSSVSLPIAAAIWAYPFQLVAFTITLCIICSYKHNANITRLINGEESKVGSHVKS